MGADPTNRRLAGETHAKVGHGRRYADVPPIKGVCGTARTELSAAVQMTRLDPAASARMTDPPLPPQELAAYVTGNVDLGDWTTAFLDAGLQVKADLLDRIPGGFPTTGAVLDFGCGSGRVLRHFLDEAHDVQIHGCDIDAGCVAWLQNHLCPPLHIVRCQATPPLPYADATFDLLWSASVFSHLVDTWPAWLLELRRILKPGATAVVSVMGAGSSQAIAGEPLDPDRTGMNVFGPGRPWVAGGPMILHSEWWVRAHWGRAFTVDAFVPGGVAGQDAVVLRRPADDVPVPDAAALLAPEPGEPRELAAALNSIRQLHRAQAELNASHDAYAQAYADETRRVAELRHRFQELEAATAASSRRRQRWRR